MKGEVQMKTPLLNTLCSYYEQENPDLFIQRTQSTELLAEKLEEYVKAAPPVEQKQFANLLYEYGIEYTNIGFIKGFKMCYWLIEELKHTSDKDFLKEVLFNEHYVEQLLCSLKEQHKDDRQYPKI